MRKYFAVIAVALLVAFAAPALAATNPFMDVPLNHWAYDAIGQLAASGILAGYPDGTYKGKQPTTRYEMAAALSRALASLDLNKTGRQDVEMLKRLVVEFKDELDALGVKVDQIYDSVGKINQRLGGWRFSGILRMDIADWDKDDDEKSGYVGMARARLFVERWFGENDEIHFFMRLRDDNGNTVSEAQINKFYVEFPAWGGTKVTVGRFAWQYDLPYYLDFGGPLAAFNDSFFTDINRDAFAIEKSFGLGGVKLAIGRPSDAYAAVGKAYSGNNNGYNGVAVDAWQFTGAATIQFSERFGLDLAADVYLGDDASVGTASFYGSNYELKLDHLYTVSGGLRINFTSSIGLKGLYYYQDNAIDYRTSSTGTWTEHSRDTSAWRGILDLKQELFGFTSLWLSYESYEAGFVSPRVGTSDSVYLWDWGNPYGSNKWAKFGNIFPWETTVYRVGASQKWSTKWRTWLYAAKHIYADAGYTSSAKTATADAESLQWGIGIEYYYNPNVAFGVSYITNTFNDEALNNAVNFEDNHRIQFRTQVVF